MDVAFAVEPGLDAAEFVDVAGRPQRIGSAVRRNVPSAELEPRPNTPDRVLQPTEEREGDEQGDRECPQPAHVRTGNR